MKLTKKVTIRSISFLFFMLVFFAGSTLSARDFYQIKVYNLKDKSQETRVESYLENAYLPALHRAGIKKVGVFKPIADDKASGTKIFVFIPIKNLNQIDKLEETIAKDSKYLTDGADYINCSWDNPPYQRIESILLKSFKEMPEFGTPGHKTPASEQIYELRSYEGPTEKMYKKKVEMFDEAGEVELFLKLNFHSVFFAEVISGSTMPNLMYMTSFADIKTHDESWDSFRNHPVWKKLSGMKEYENTVSNAVITLLHPTEFSDI